ncbi:MAG TPA: multidrug effflux MFS transporter [Terricaulis sp.]|nr:multidrug effflux MFS transporter [Terricaulis sp.]
MALVASLMALNALSIDIMLPALPDIGSDFALSAANDRQLIIVAYIFMFGISQLIYGPLSDAFGRRAVLLWAIGFYILGALLCTIAPSFELMLAARALQGVAAGATRVIATAVVRDLTSGPRMAQIMSMAMTVFMIVPILAPGLGQLILFVAPWRWIFGALLVYAIIVLIWAYFRLPETLRPENTTPFHLRAIARAARAVLSDRQALGYMIASTFIVGCMFGYVTSSEQLFVDVYHLGESFALAFAALAVAMSVGAFMNSRLVMRFGMRRISQSGLMVFLGASAVLTALVMLGLAQFWVFFGLFSIAMGAFGMIAGNFNALAMENAGRTAGAAASLYGAVTGAAGAAVGGLIARQFDGTALPFVLGMTILAALSLAVVFWTERGKLFKNA